MGNTQMFCEKEARKGGRKEGKAERERVGRKKRRNERVKERRENEGSYFLVTGSKDSKSERHYSSFTGKAQRI
jgi:hypothetical protein